MEQWKKRSPIIRMAVMTLLVIGGGFAACTGEYDLSGYSFDGKVHLPDGGAVDVKSDGGHVIVSGNAGAGGVATGGTSSGGTGGTATGGTSSGGSAGAATGGSSTGGVATGGTSSGGTGGTATGGSSTGGTATGGTSSGGTGGTSVSCGGPYTNSAKHAVAMARISGGVPAFSRGSNFEQSPPSYTNDNNITTRWRSWNPNDSQHTNPYITTSNPQWIAFNLSSVPAAQRQQVLVLWSNATGSYTDRLTGFGQGDRYNEPRDYALRVNTDTGSVVPTTGWTSPLSITASSYHSRQHVTNLGGATWFQFYVTAINGSAYNRDAEFEVDVYDCSAGSEDTWIIYGDSITAITYQGNEGPSVAEQIHAAKPAYYPAMEGAGIGYLRADDMLATDANLGGQVRIDALLALTPAKYVCLEFGTNDVNQTTGQGPVDNAYNSMVSLISHVRAAGKIPCLSKVPWTQDSATNTQIQALNAKYDQLFASDPGIIRGPDRYTVLSGHPTWMQDTLHPNATGRTQLRAAMAAALMDPANGIYN